MVLQSVMLEKGEHGWDGGMVGLYIVEFMDQRLRRDLFVIGLYSLNLTTCHVHNCIQTQIIIIIIFL